MKEDVFTEGWGILPRRILRDKDVTPFAKLLYVEISSLCASEGFCWASNKYLAERMGSTERTVSRSITELKKYLTFKSRGNGNRKILVQQPDSFTKKEKVEKIETNGGEVNEMIDMFKSVNPSVNILFKRKNERDAMGRMITQHGREKMMAVIGYLPKSNAHKFAPKITTPVELEEKFGKLIAWAESEKQGKGSSSKGKKILI